MAPHRTSSRNSRLAATLARWGDICLYALVGAVAYWMTLDIVQAAAAPLVLHIRTLCDIGLAPLLLAASLVLPFWAARSRLVYAALNPREQIRLWFTYPSIYISAGIGIVLLSVLDPATRLNAHASLMTLSMPVSTMGYGLVCSLIGIFLICMGLFDIQPFYGSRPVAQRSCKPFLPSPHPGEAWCQLTAEEFDRVLDWIKSDEEVSDPQQDVFGSHRNNAYRIATRLCDDWGAASPSIALVGPRGCGKTTIAKMVEAIINDRADSRKGPCQILMCRLSLWGYESSGAASVGILDAVIHVLSSRVSTLSVWQVPDRYAAAISDVGGPFASVVRLIKGSQDPRTALAAIQQVLTAIDYRLVVWIEDLERFGGEVNENDRDAAAVHEERLAPLRALLYKLDSLPSIVVITSDVTLASRFDRDKLARFVEHVPKLSPIDVWRTVAPVRDACLSLWPRAGLLEASPRWRSENDMSRNEETFIFQMLSDSDALEWRAAVATLVQYPRVLKQMLRATVYSWSVLCGEIDIDDLLLLNAIRAGDPDVFAWLVHRGPELALHGCIQQKPTESPLIPGQGTTVEVEYSQLFYGRQSHTRRCSECILHRIIPYVRTAQGRAGRETRQPFEYLRPQGLLSCLKPDRFQMVLSESLQADTQRDQDLLQILVRWRESGYSISDYREVLGPRGSDVLQFASFVTQDELLQYYCLRCDWIAQQTANLEWLEYDPFVPWLTRVMGLTNGTVAQLLLAPSISVVEHAPRVNIALMAMLHTVCGWAHTSLHTEGLAPTVRRKCEHLIKTDEAGDYSILDAMCGGHPRAFGRLQSCITTTAHGRSSDLWNDMCRAVVRAMKTDLTYSTAILSGCFSWSIEEFESNLAEISRVLGENAKDMFEACQGRIDPERMSKWAHCDVQVRKMIAFSERAMTLRD